MRKNLIQKTVFVALSLGLVAGGAGCSKAEPAAPATTQAALAPVVQNPLTGEILSAQDQLPDHPAVAIKIPADKKAHPQSGLNQADNVWVELVEGGEIRYTAVFYTNTPDSVGPVRSVRPMDGEIVGPLDGVFLCSGGQEQFIAQVRPQVGQFYTEDEAGKGPVFRIKERKIPYNLYASVPKVLDKAKTDNPVLQRPKAVWDFAKQADQASAVVAKDAQPAAEIEAHYPAWRSLWTWDPGMKSWKRSDKKRPTLDSSGEPISTTNLVILQVTTENTGAKDPVGEPVISSKMLGEGPAKVASGGKIIDATWRKTGVKEPVQLVDRQGKPIKLAPGRTWIEAVPVADNWLSINSSSGH